ncbi:hypothetical protein GN157_05630 [Flavobacterium rakeshii]|uniref:CopG family transcriptional regulator n=1 Tax=Flavobacterium rakeshii TaxID=1038845 RepID=A0A6N8HCB7_9FLAO|nr:hypothetical protein [Flavobacterium rakeshii]MUV03185.1 hypothetical protein [Flavobacterium rakeshii]
MIKKSTYIRSFTPAQRRQLEKIAAEENIKTVTGILFFTLEQYGEQKSEIERLKRIISYKQKKIEKLQQ